QQILDTVVRRVRENYVGARVVRAFSRQQDEKKEFEETTGLLKKTQLLAGRISAMMNPLTYALVNGAIIWILLLGGGQVYSGSVTKGEMTALVNYMMQILLALVALANLIVTVTRALASAVRVNDVFAMEVTMTDEGNTVQKEKENSPR